MTAVVLSGAVICYYLTMYKRNGSFFKRLLIATCLLAVFLYALKPVFVFAQASNSTDTAAVSPGDTLSIDEQNIGPDPVIVTDSDTASPDANSPEVAADTSTADTSDLPIEEITPAIKTKQPLLNRYLSEGIAVLEEKAAARPVLFSAVLTGLVAILLLLGFIRGRRRNRTVNYIALTRHRLRI